MSEATAAPLMDILEGVDTPEPVEATETPAVAEPEVEAVTEVETPTGETEGDKPEVTEEPPASPEPVEKTVPLKALEDERRKRQELEQRLEQQPKQEAPDPLDDPDGFRQYQDNARLNDRIEISVEIAREMHEDFDSVHEVFMEEAAKNPVLAQAAMQSKAPGIHIYREGKRLAKAREIGDPDEYANRKVQEATKALATELAELKAQINNAQKRDSIPTTLADQRSVGGMSNPKQPEHTPLHAVLDD